MLRLQNVDTHYGAIQALHGVSLEVEAGEIVTLIGANGAGKTTTLRTISGLTSCSSGSILLEDRPIEKVRAEDLVGMGLAHVPQGRRIFPGLTVRENLEVAASSWRRGRQSIEKDLDRVHTLFPKLKDRHRQLGWSLSGGEQQMLAIGRALMARPRALLLDEPSLGLAPVVVSGVFDTIKAINEEGVAVLIVEQNAFMALSIAHRGYVMEMGRIVLEDTAQNLLNNERVQRAYLGE